MPLFRRKKNDADDPDDSGVPTSDAGDAIDLTDEPAVVWGSPVDDAEQLAPSDGPWDSGEAPDDDLPRLDLGGLRVPGFPGMELRLEVDRGTERVIAATAVAHDGQLQLQPFAAPRNGGLWDEVRTEIVAGIRSAGGTVTEVDGRFGKELVAEVPGDDGTPGLHPARFIGVDGRRWFLRGVLSGAAARPGEAADLLEQVYAGTVVVRGDQAMAPRDLLALLMPDEGQPGEPEAEGRPRLEAFQRRGPEITEIH